jgi:Polyketide cyclase / dehydrase and lipid transport
VGRASASITVKGRAAEAEALWYDRHRWASWVDGFGHIALLEGDWPEVGARLIWDSPPGGRGRVQERVVAYEVRVGQTVEVEDATMTGRQTVAFTPGLEETGVTLTVEYELKQRNVLTPLVDPLFVRRAVTDSLRRTLRKFANERAAEIQFG